MSSFERVDEPPSPDKRRPTAHKGDFGHVLVVAGSRRMMGAALMSGAAATRVGAGLCTIACPSTMQPIVPLYNPTSMSIPLAETADGSIALGAWRQLEVFFDQATVCAVGPGLSRDPSTQRLVRRLVRRCPLPMVLDADGLNALEGQVELVRDAQGPVVLTPHPGEMARLTGQPVGEIQQHRILNARRLSRSIGAVVVLKGAGTVVASPDKVYLNRTGNPHMASGGTGDVLTGMVAGLLAQRLRPFDAARTAVYWHGLAGDRAPNAAGPGAVTATDILEELRNSAAELDWYQEELDLGSPSMFDPDDEEDELESPT